MYDDDDRWLGLKVALVGLFLCGLGLFAAYRWYDTNLNPKPYADESLRTFLAAVQREDWATAMSRVAIANSATEQERLRQGWATCTARHGALTGYTVRNVPFNRDTARATLTFADGTTAAWEVLMTPRSSPGWKLPYGVPPACGK